MPEIGVVGKVRLKNDLKNRIKHHLLVFKGQMENDPIIRVQGSNKKYSLHFSNMPYHNQLTVSQQHAMMAQTRS